MIRFSGGVEDGPIEIEFAGSDLPKTSVKTTQTEETITVGHYPNVTVNLGSITSPEDHDGLVAGLDYLAYYILAK